MEEGARVRGCTVCGPCKTPAAVTARAVRVQVAAALRSGNLGFVTVPVSSSRTSTVQLYLTAADPCHLPARWVERASAFISRGWVALGALFRFLCTFVIKSSMLS